MTKRRQRPVVEDRASSVATSTAASEDGTATSSAVDNTADDDNEYEVSHIGRRRLNPVTGAVEYLVFWEGWAEPTWEPRANLSDRLEPLLIEADVNYLAEQQQREARILPLDPTTTRRLIALRHEDRESRQLADGEGEDDDDDDDAHEDNGALKLTSSNIMFDLIESMYAATFANKSLTELASGAPATTPFHSTAIATMRDALLGLPDEALLAAESAGRISIISPPNLKATVGNRKGTWPSKHKGMARRLCRHSSVMIAHAPCRLRIKSALLNPDAPLRRVDETIEIVGLRKTFPSAAASARGRGRPARELRADADEDGEDVDDEHDDDDADCDCSFNVDFLVHDDSTAPGVAVSLPLEQFRYQYPQELIRFLVSNAHLYPLPHQTYAH